MSVSVKTTVFAFMLGAMLPGAPMGAAFAQEQAPTPGKSTESFEDWSVECTSVKAANKAVPSATKGDKPVETDVGAGRFCEAVQVYRNNQNGQEIARIAFGYGVKDSEKEGMLLAGLRVVVDVSFKAAPRVVSGEDVLFEGAFERCLGSFCYAAFSLPEGGAKPLQDAASPALQFPIANGRMIAINISTKGLGDALKLLAARSK